MLWNRIVRYKQKGVRWGRDPRYRRLGKSPCNLFAQIIDNDEALKILQTQSSAARELYSVWKQSIDNADSLQEKMVNLVSIVGRITHLAQLKGPDMRDALKEITTMFDAMYAMCADTGRTLHLLYFAEGHGEALYKLIRKDEGIEALGFNQITDDTEYARKLESARKQRKCSQRESDKAKRESRPLRRWWC